MKQWTTVCMACTVAAMAACSAYAQQVVAPESVASAPSAQSVTVTGTKRKQLEQEATQSLNVLKPDDLINERDAYDALLRLPNVSIGARSSLPTVRGVDGNGVAYGGGGAVSGGRPRFATYVDGVARAYSFSPDGNASLWDVKQVEVYRGAQSGLLGRNAGAGAMVIVTHDPVLENEAALQIGARSARSTWNAAAMVNRRLADDLALRVTAEGSHGTNWRNPVGDEFGGKSTAELEAQNFERYRAKLQWTPAALPGLSLRFAHDDQRDTSPNGVDTVTGPDYALREITASSYSFFVRRNAVTSLQAAYDLGRGWSLEGILARQRSRTDAPPPVKGSAGFLDVFADSTENSFEPRLTYSAGRDSRTGVVFGAFAFSRDRDEGGRPGSAFAYEADDRARTRSLFVDGRWQLAAAWDLIGGLRVERERQRRVFSSGGVDLLKFDKKTDAVLPKLGFEWHLDAERAIGAVAYRGYQAGGGGVSFVSFTPYLFDKETSTTAELTWRSTWLARTLTVNANVFRTRFAGYQLDGVGPGGPDDVIYLNAQRVSTAGAELDASWRPQPAVELFAQLGLLRARLDRFDDGANAGVNGNRLQRSPSHTLRVGGAWTLPGGLTLGGDVYRSAGYYSTYFNTQTDRAPAFTTLNVHTRWAQGPFALTAYVNNATDRTYYTERSVGAFGDIAQLAPPRTAGVTATYRF
jgi:outer membrane receptor protein involved in Fe transport